jgi:hypothetical protein
MSNVLSEQTKQQVIALGQLGWSLRRIQKETGVRRETASVYLKAAGIPVPPPGRRKQQSAKPAIPVTTGSSTPPNPNINLNPNPNSETSSNRGKPNPAKPAIPVTTGFGVDLRGLESKNHGPTASACEPFREAIELGLSRGRNAMAIWQDLVADCGFQGCGSPKLDCALVERRRHKIPSQS